MKVRFKKEGTYRDAHAFGRPGSTLETSTPLPFIPFAPIVFHDDGTPKLVTHLYETWNWTGQFEDRCAVYIPSR